MNDPLDEKTESPTRDPASESSPARLFIAIALPQRIRNVISGLSEDLKKGFQFTSCRPAWVSPDAMHLTLLFLGATPRERVETIAKEIDRISARFGPLDLRLRDLGVFPHWRRPRVLWVGVHVRRGELAGLQNELEEMAVAQGRHPSRDAFQPHLSLARFHSGKGIEAVRKIVASHRTFRSELFGVAEIILFESTLRSEGALHTPVRRFPLLERRPERGP